MTKTKVDGSVVPAIKNEAVEVENLHAIPKRDPDSLDGILSSAKCLQMGEYPFGYDFDLKSYYEQGALDSGETREGEHDLKFDVLDGLLDEVDEVDDIHAANDLSTACADFPWDIEYVENIYEFSCPPREVSRFRNPHSESNSPGSGSSNGTNGISDTSTATILESGHKNDLLDNVVTCELHVISRSECGCHLPFEDQICLTSPDMENLNDLDNGKHCIIVNGMSSDEKEKSSVIVTKVGASIRQKRLRKPTRRFIDEFSKPKSTDVMEIHSIPTGASKDKYLKVDSCKEHHVRVVAYDQGEGPLSGTSSLTLHESRPHRGRRKKLSPLLEHQSENELSDFDDEPVNLGRRSKTVADRRKHQRMWTLSEVMKLVDGISQRGVGRWTDIKRLFFASSAYRTPVDLRDKWRNLLRASSAEKQKQRNGRKEMEEKLKHAIRPLPKSVLRRIRELATVHPYPRDRNMKFSRISHVPPPAVSATEVDLASRGARKVRRKSS